MNHIRELRKENGMSQQQLADKMFVNQTAVSQWERGATMPEPQAILRLAELFGVSTDYLLGRTDKKEPPVEDERPNADVRAAQLRLADDLYDRLTPENRAKADSYLAYLLAEQADPGDKG